MEGVYSKEESNPEGGQNSTFEHKNQPKNQKSVKQVKQKVGCMIDKRV
jgi:hypothetical protein